MKSNVTTRRGICVLLVPACLAWAACSGSSVGSTNQNNQPGVCGNGVVEGGEACDGADMGGATCVSLGFAGGLLVCGADCQFVTSRCDPGAACGDGVLDAGEDCDDGNTAAGDGCGPTCLQEACGNGVVDPGEVCDDGNTAAWDGCNNACQCVEFQVNTYTTGDQYHAVVARAANGSFVVVWGSDGQDGSGMGVYGQRFDATGNPLGTEFRANSYTTLSQTGPWVAMAPDGRFVVLWQSEDQDGSGYGVYFQRYSAAGVAQGLETRVNTTTFGSQNGQSVEMAADGSFVVVYQSDPSNYDIYFRRYDANGVALSPETQVNVYTTGHQSMAHVAVEPLGSFVIVWSSNGQDGDGYGVYGQRYLSSGVPDGGQFQINQTTAGDQRRPDVAMADNGSFAVVWMDGSLVTNTWDVYHRRFSAAGVALGDEAQVNTWTTGQDLYPYIDMLGDGRYLVMWMSDGPDGDGLGAFARMYSAAGVPTGPEFQLNTYTTSDQSWPHGVLNPDGSAWMFWYSEDLDGSGRGVFGRRFDSSGVGLCRGI